MNEVKSSPQISSYIQFPKSFYELHHDFTSPDTFNKSRCPSWYTSTSTTAMEVTDLESSTGLWRAISQFTLSEETKADVYYYGFTIVFLLVVVFLALYFLWRYQTKSFKFPFFSVTFLFQGFLPDIFKVIGLLKENTF